MKRSVYGLLDRSNLLDLLRNFIIFEIEEGRPVKKVARYQQFAAANEIVIQESKRPLTESIARAAQERSPGLLSEDATRISAALVEKADEILFPGWTEQEHLDTELFREFTKLLVRMFSEAGLHRRDRDFVERSIKLLRKANYRVKSDE